MQVVYLLRILSQISSAVAANQKLPLLLSGKHAAGGGGDIEEAQTAIVPFSV